MGIYSPITGDLRFPVQMIEMIFSLLLSGAIFLVIKKRRYNTGGVALFLSLSIFAVGRFFLEFLKDSDKRLLGFLHPLQLHMLFLFFVCIISLAYIHLLKREKAARR
jgi:prolipoprotein diacylglyceryltransferase